jgi:hypothetical protein
VTTEIAFCPAVYLVDFLQQKHRNVKEVLFLAAKLIKFMGQGEFLRFSALKVISMYDLKKLHS